jgi:PTH1 family peptidyl-tRNA hydrolase
MALFSKKATCDLLVVGLGNPGSEFAQTRHNLGYMCVDSLAQAAEANYWKLRCDAMCAEAVLDGVRIALAKPQTFMNRSGRSVKGLLRHFGLDVSQVIVVHDDLDIPEHALKLKLGGGHGGHNGLRDINSAVGDGYMRLKVGIGRPPGKMPADRFVLERVGGDALEQMQVDARVAAEAVRDVVRLGFAKAQTNLNASVRE